MTLGVTKISSIILGGQPWLSGRNAVRHAKQRQNAADRPNERLGRGWPSAWLPRPRLKADDQDQSEAGCDKEGPIKAPEPSQQGDAGAETVSVDAMPEPVPGVTVS